MNPVTRIPVLIVAVLTATVATAKTASLPESVLEARWEQFYRSTPQTGPGGFPYAECFRESAKKHSLPEPLLLAVARGESDFDARARSSANAYGLMQILWPGTARHLGLTSLAEVLDPCTNVDAGTRYLKELLKRYHGNLHRALAAYNYGPGRIPADGGPLPSGAVWYSGYILRHLEYVLNESMSLPYDGTGKLLVIHFDRPYRAAAFVENMQPRLGNHRLDWFRQPDGRFRVVMLYDTGVEKEEGMRVLTDAGFRFGGE